MSKHTYRCMHNSFPAIPRLQVSSFLPVGGFYKTAAHSEVEAIDANMAKQTRKVNTQHFNSRTISILEILL